jgi:glutamine amidotransferase
MGWNDVEICKPSILFKDMYDEPRFYFVHSYYIQCNREEDVLTRSDYHLKYVSAFEKDNIFGVQFHPEKSHKFGLKLLKNFSDL